MPRADKLSEQEKFELIRRYHERGYTYRKIKEILKVGPQTITKALKQKESK